MHRNSQTGTQTTPKKQVKTSSRLFSTSPRRITTPLISTQKLEHANQLAFTLLHTLPHNDKRMISIQSTLHQIYLKQFQLYRKATKKLLEFHSISMQHTESSQLARRMITQDYYYETCQSKLEQLEKMYLPMKALIEDTSYSLLQNLHPILPTFWTCRHYMDLLSQAQQKHYAQELIRALPEKAIDFSSFKKIIHSVVSQNSATLSTKEKHYQDTISYWLNRAASLCDVITRNTTTEGTSKTCMFQYTPNRSESMDITQTPRTSHN